MQSRILAMHILFAWLMPGPVFLRSDTTPVFRPFLLAELFCDHHRVPLSSARELTNTVLRSLDLQKNAVVHRSSCVTIFPCRLGISVLALISQRVNLFARPARRTKSLFVMLGDVLKNTVISIGTHSLDDEAFYADWEVVDDFDKGVKIAKNSGNEVQWIEEETCRFQLSMFKPRLHEWLDSGVLPKESQEHARLLALMHSTLDLLEDPSVSRPSSRVPWGIPVPGRPDQTIYVWFDALLNYLTAGNVSLNSETDNSDATWPPDCQLIGKDILRFHAILWPAFLMAMNLPLPKLIIPHGHILVSGTKMSKSLGNVVSPREILYHFASCLTQNNLLSESESQSMAADCLRYCLIRSVCLQEDASFSLPLAIEIVNTELVNWLGNLLSRITSKKVVPTQTVPTLGLAEAQTLLSDPADAEFLNDLKSLPATVNSLWFDRLQPHLSVDAMMRAIRHTNAFVDRHRPWDRAASTEPVVGVALEALRLVGCLLAPLIPTLSDRLLNGLGIYQGALRSSLWQLPIDHQGQYLIPRLRP